MKKLLLIFCLGQLSMCEPALAQIQWQGLNAGWSYENKFTNRLNNDYNILWNTTCTFSYQRWNMRVQYAVPTFKYSFKQPFYNLTFEYQILKRK